MKRLNDPELFSCIKRYLTVYLPQIKNRSSNTVEVHRFSLNLYLDFLIEAGVKNLSEIKAADFCQENILLFMGWLNKERKNEVTTVNVRLSNIRSFCKYLNKNGLISHSDVSKKTGIRDKFYIALLYDSGCRNQEILDLQVKDFVINRNGTAELHILGKGRKYRVTPISDEVTKLFCSYCGVFHPERNTAQQHWLFYTKRNEVITKMSSDNVQRFLSSYEASARRSQGDIMHLHPHLLDIPGQCIYIWLGYRFPLSLNGLVIQIWKQP